MYTMFMKEQFVLTDPSLSNSQRLNVLTQQWASQSVVQKARYRALAKAANETEGDVGDKTFAELMSQMPLNRSRKRQQGVKRQSIEKSFSDMRADSVWDSGTGVFGFDGPMVR